MASAGGVQSIVWSPDSRYAVAYVGGAKPWLINTREKKVEETKTIIPFASDARASAWSPNGVLIATRGGGVAGSIQLVSFPEFMPINSLLPRDWKSRLPKCKSDPETSHLTFTPDSQFLWIGCRGGNEQGTFTAAVKLSIPDLEIVDEVEADVPEIGQRTETSFGWFHRHSLTGNITYYMLARVYTIKGRPPRQYIVAIDLAGKKQVNRNLVSEQALYGSGRFLSSENGVIGYITNETVGTIMEDGGPSSRIILYLLKNSPDGPLEQIDVDAFIDRSKSSVHAHFTIQTARLISDSELIIGKSGLGFEQEPRRLYKIAFRDQITNSKQVTSFHGISISPDERCMVSIVNTPHMMITHLLFKMVGVTLADSGVEIFSLN